MALADPILAGLGFGSGRIATIEIDDPDLLQESLRTVPAMPPAPRPASFRPTGGKKGVLRIYPNCAVELSRGVIVFVNRTVAFLW